MPKKLSFSSYHLKLLPVALNTGAVAFWQTTGFGLATVGAGSNAVTVTTKLAVGPSQPAAVNWLTLKVILPATAVLGVGAPGRGVPEASYHLRLTPWPGSEQNA